MITRSAALFFSVFLLSCSSGIMYINKEDGDPFALEPPPKDDLLYRVFLLGDAGAPSLDVQEPTLKLFQSFAEVAGERSAALFLGDNIYLNGLPDSTHARREFYEQKIIEQLKTVENFPGRVVFIPGITTGMMENQEAGRQYNVRNDLLKSIWTVAIHSCLIMGFPAR